MDERRKRLVYRASRRSFKEADLVLGLFAKQHIEDFSDEEIEVFEQLLDVPDHTLYNWILGKEPVQPCFQGAFVQRLKAFTHSKTIARMD